MPLPERSSSVNERSDSLLPVDNDKAEVIKNCAAAGLELFTNTVVKPLRSRWPRAYRPNIGGDGRRIRESPW
jgi:hypothetical protein